MYKYKSACPILGEQRSAYQKLRTPVGQMFLPFISGFLLTCEDASAIYKAALGIFKVESSYSQKWSFPESLAESSTWFGQVQAVRADSVKVEWSGMILKWNYLKTEIDASKKSF